MMKQRNNQIQETFLADRVSHRKLCDLCKALTFHVEDVLPNSKMLFGYTDTRKMKQVNLVLVSKSRGVEKKKK